MDSFSIIDSSSFPLEAPYVPASEESKKTEERILDGEMDENTILKEPEVNHKVHMETHANSHSEEKDMVGETPNSQDSEKVESNINDGGLQMVIFKPQLCNNTKGILKVSSIMNQPLVINHEIINTQNELHNAENSVNGFTLDSN